jgi:hypothetical protein
MEIGIFTSQISYTVINITVVAFFVIVVIVYVVVVLVVTIFLFVLHLLLLTLLVRSSYGLCKVMKFALQAVTCRKPRTFLSKMWIYNL